MGIWQKQKVSEKPEKKEEATFVPDAIGDEGGGGISSGGISNTTAGLINETPPRIKPKASVFGRFLQKKYA